MDDSETNRNKGIDHTRREESPRIKAGAKPETRVQKGVPKIGSPIETEDNVVLVERRHRALNKEREGPKVPNRCSEQVGRWQGAGPRQDANAGDIKAASSGIMVRGGWIAMTTYDSAGLDTIVKNSSGWPVEFSMSPLRIPAGGTSIRREPGHRTRSRSIERPVVLEEKIRALRGLQELQTRLCCCRDLLGDRFLGTFRGLQGEQVSLELWGFDEQTQGHPDLPQDLQGGLNGIDEVGGALSKTYIGRYDLKQSSPAAKC
ncbi:hypothetical protein B0H17DRAFT_1143808 [Mycena rosella]|uniref:Uncharacterized protein n=1 Tax=Mycena rosella TaxID=1033263 RepID=A0AAD7G3L9_MYCRO|nr:hypothetical protein B0H17DRAFT_1143808 [Mycena rosella]